MATINITSQENEITQIKLKNNEQYYLTDTAVRTAVSNIQVSLSTARDETSLSETALSVGDSFETAIGKLHTGLGTTEQVVEAGLNDLDERLNKKLTDYSKEYLTFTALQDTTFTFTQNALQYSIDGGTTWTTLAANTTSPTVAAGSKIIWKQTGLTPTSGSGIGKFSATGNFEVSGNIMSLLYGDNFIGQKDLTGKNYAFYNLFSGCTGLTTAKNLVLPATTLAQSCYSSMFYGCTSLTTAPELPATTLASSCYSNMFSDCTSLTTAPELPATTLTINCYNGMFYGCTALTTAPELPATTLVDSCYGAMFLGCTSLTTAPELPATTLEMSYNQMFYGCTSLNYIKCLATIKNINSTNNWVQNVAATGTFIKADEMTWTTGTSGIPSGWNAYTEDEYKEVRHYELATVATSGSYNDLTNKPTNVSAFTNDANYATQTDVSTAVSNLVNSAPTTLDTLNELAAALGDDPNFATTVSGQIGAKYTKPSTGIPVSDLESGALEHTHSVYLTSAASTTHNHSAYALATHTHSTYATTEQLAHSHDLSHTHNVYLTSAATTTHTHSVYATTGQLAHSHDLSHSHSAYLTAHQSLTHTHSAYATTSQLAHSHDYAATNHTHSVYLTSAASTTHSHSAYALATHIHSTYATTEQLAHSHDLSHTHNVYLTSAATTTHTHIAYATTGQLAHSHDLSHSHSAYLTAHQSLTHTHSAYATTSQLAHSHDYAATNHTHSVYLTSAASTTHSHSAYATTGQLAHSHDLSHSHSAYALTGHSHSYAATNHSHSAYLTAHQSLTHTHSAYATTGQIVALEESIDAEFESTASILDVHNRKITALETALGDVEAILQSI